MDCRDEGQRANANIRAIIRDLARKGEQNPGVIYAKLHLILAEVESNDKAWERLEFEVRDEIAASITE